MPMLPSSSPGADDDAVAHLSALAGEIDVIFAHFQMSDKESTDLLREILLLTIYRWDLVASHDLWLLATVRRGCLRRLQRRAREAASH
ncbi:MAG TPA: hypothetical protein VIW92_15385 [Thermoanaerobaculia bacterium]